MKESKSGEVDILAQRYSIDFKIPLSLAQIIARRFPTYEDARAFIYPDLHQLHSPEDIPDIKSAADTIVSALRLNKPLLIYCHDDPDGYTSAVIMYKTLCDLRKKNSPEIYIYPIVREKDGYVLNPLVLDEYIKLGVETLIAVDFGISNFENFYIAQEKSINLVVCDHHETTFEDFPFPAVDPKRKDSKYPFRELAGVGVALRLCEYLYEKFLNLSRDEFYSLKNEFLAITMVGTIADRVAPIGENRVLCWEGLKTINRLNTPWVRYYMTNGPINFVRVQFEIIPVLSSAANLDPKLGIELLLSNDYERVAKLISELAVIEEERKRIIDKFTQDGIDMAKVYERIVISIFPSTFNGLKVNHLGAIASKLRDHFQRTSVVILVKDGRCFGESRSFTVNLYEMLSSIKQLFIDFGGHKRAAGFSMEEENLDRFIEGICIFIEKNEERYAGQSLKPEAVIDKSQVKILEQLMPFGDGNRPPVLTDGVDLYTIDHKLNIIELGIWQT